MMRPSQKIDVPLPTRAPSADSVAAGIVREYGEKVALLKSRMGIKPETQIPVYILLAKLSKIPDHWRLLNVGLEPWQSPNKPTRKGNYCAHFYAGRLDATPELIQSSLALGVIYFDIPNKGAQASSRGETPLEIARRIGNPGVAEAIERAQKIAEPETARELARLKNVDRTGENERTTGFTKVLASRTHLAPSRRGLNVAVGEPEKASSKKAARSGTGRSKPARKKVAGQMGLF